MSFKIKRYKFVFPVLIVIILIAGAILYRKKIKTVSPNIGQSEILNPNISQALKDIPNNTIIYLGPKDSFILPEGYKADSQVVDRSILIYPKDQKNIEYKGADSLESFKGIFITSANMVASEEVFNEGNKARFDSFLKANPDSDATSQTTKDSKGRDKFIISQTKPFKMVETMLNRGLIIEIVSYEETDAYKRIVDTYGDSELLANSDHKALYQIQKDLVVAYSSQDADKVFSLLSTDAQKKNSLLAIKSGLKTDIFKDMTSIEPTILICQNRNFILQSRVLFNDNFMMRVDISYKVEYDGERNNWSIDSYVIKNKEKYLSTVETE